MIYKGNENIKIINFHTIVGKSNIQWFENIVAYLKNTKTIVSCDELYRYLKNDISLKEAYLLTVDDGHISFYNNIYPIIKKYNVPITVFVSPKVCKERSNFWFQEMADYEIDLSKRIVSELINIPIKEIVDIELKPILKELNIELVHEYIERYQKKTKINRKPFLNVTVKNLIEMNKSGLVEIGAHTMNHPILINESNNSSKYEIEESIDELGNILDQKINYFAYPNGIPKIDYSLREVECVKSRNINISFSTSFERVRKNLNLMEIPRGELSNGRFSFKMKLSLWDHWRKVTNIKNGQIELKDRKNISELLERSFRTVNN